VYRAAGARPPTSESQPAPCFVNGLVHSAACRPAGDGGRSAGPAPTAHARPRTLGVDRGLAGQLLQHLGGAGQPVTALTDANVQAELVDLQAPHGVLGLVLRLHGLSSTGSAKRRAWGCQPMHARANGRLPAPRHRARPDPPPPAPHPPATHAPPSGSMSRRTASWPGLPRPGFAGWARCSIAPHRRCIPPIALQPWPARCDGHPRHPAPLRRQRGRCPPPPASGQPRVGARAHHGGGSVSAGARRWRHQHERNPGDEASEPQPGGSCPAGTSSVRRCQRIPPGRIAAESQQNRGRRAPTGASRSPRGGPRAPLLPSSLLSRIRTARPWQRRCRTAAASSARPRRSRPSSSCRPRAPPPPPPPRRRRCSTGKACAPTGAAPTPCGRCVRC